MTDTNDNPDLDLDSYLEAMSETHSLDAWLDRLTLNTDD